MSKVHLTYSDGNYYTVFVDEKEASILESNGNCVISIPEDIAKEWSLFIDKQREWHKYWSKQDNEWFVKRGE